MASASEDGIDCFGCGSIERVEFEQNAFEKAIGFVIEATFAEVSHFFEFAFGILKANPFRLGNRR